MNRNYTIYIYTPLFILFSQGIFAQNFEIILKTENTENQVIVDALLLKKKYASKAEVNNRLERLINQLKLKGYFTVSFAKQQFEGSAFRGSISLGQKTNFVFVRFDKDQQRIFEKDKTREKVVIENIDKYKKALADVLLEKGIPFSEIEFNNYSYNGEDLEVALQLNLTQKRIIDKVVIKGYENFPKSHLQHFLRLKGANFTPTLIKQTESRINSLVFAASSKTPEVLFKKDSTILYLYIQKKQASNIDAMVNLNTDEANQLQFNGIVDLSLNNVLNYGESLKVFWNRVDADIAEFKFQSTLPYLMKSGISSNLGFQIYRQDSTFLNTTATLAFFRDVNPKIQLGIDLSFNSSTNIAEQSPTDIIDFSSSAVGLFLQYNSQDYALKNQQRFSSKIGIRYRNRNSDDGSVDQWLIEAEALKNIKVSQRSLLHVHHETKLLFSENLILNELYRIGGISSIRSFNEQSIFASKYSFLNTEFRWYVSDNYLHTISDVAWAENLDQKSTFFYSFGLGYNFRKNNNLINLAYVVGAREGEVLSLDNSRLLVKFITFF